MNLGSTIIPRSDQLNADDLIAGPMTITITSVDAGTAEQPIVIHYEGDKGRPYKPSKSMRRVLVAVWGTDGDSFVGRRLTLYRDPQIKFGGEPVGGIRISHASYITEPVQIALTETRGKRKPFRVEPLPPSTASDIDVQALTDVGHTKAREGTASLQAWFTTLPVAAKKALKPTLDSQWKQMAEAADSSGKAAA